jgi:hypothetical protein
VTAPPWSLLWLKTWSTALTASDPLALHDRVVVA